MRVIKRSLAGDLAAFLNVDNYLDNYWTSRVERRLPRTEKVGRIELVHDNRTEEVNHD